MKNSEAEPLLAQKAQERPVSNGIDRQRLTRTCAVVLALVALAALYGTYSEDDGAVSRESLGKHDKPPNHNKHHQTPDLPAPTSKGRHSFASYSISGDKNRKMKKGPDLTSGGSTSSIEITQGEMAPYRAARRTLDPAGPIADTEMVAKAPESSDLEDTDMDDPPGKKLDGVQHDTDSKSSGSDLEALKMDRRPTKKDADHIMDTDRKDTIATIDTTMDATRGGAHGTDAKDSDEKMPVLDMVEADDEEKPEHRKSGGFLPGNPDHPHTDDVRKSVNNLEETDATLHNVRHKTNFLPGNPDTTIIRDAEKGLEETRVSLDDYHHRTKAAMVGFFEDPNFAGDGRTSSKDDSVSNSESNAVEARHTIARLDNNGQPMRMDSSGERMRPREPVEDTDEDENADQEEEADSALLDELYSTSSEDGEITTSVDIEDNDDGKEGEEGEEEEEDTEFLMRDHLKSAPRGQSSMSAPDALVTPMDGGSSGKSRRMPRHRGSSKGKSHRHWSSRGTRASSSTRRATKMKSSTQTSHKGGHHKSLNRHMGSSIPDMMATRNSMDDRMGSVMEEPQEQRERMGHGMGVDVNMDDVVP